MKNRLLIVCAPLLVLALALAGCDSGPPKGTVKGKVTLDDKVVTAGNITFVGPGGKTGSAGVNKDGTYQSIDAPVGACKITVLTPEPTKEKSPIAGDVETVKTPEKYTRADTTDLTFEVKTGMNTYDIIMKSK